MSAAEGTRPRPSLRRAARWAAGRLPEDRRPAAVALARAARSLALGTPVPGGGPAPAATPTGPRKATGPTPWLRSRPDLPDLPHPHQELADPGEAAAVRAGWQLVGAYEALTTEGANRVFAPELAAWYAYAEDTLPTSVRGEGVQYFANNWLRFRRMADLTRDGDRIFDVGTGRGELARILMAMRDIEYRGIELTPSQVNRFRDWQQREYPDKALEVEIGDLYDLTPEDIGRHGTTLVLCCEVLEHVPDAEAALEVLGRTLPEDADLVFSVPLHGRLENVWGHVSVFDVHRLHEMLERAGLVAHHVEPLANFWTIVVANRHRERSERVARAGRRPDVLAGAPLTRHRPYLPVPREKVTLVPSPGHPAPVLGEDTRTTAAHLSFTGRTALDLDVDGLEAMRLRLSPDDDASAAAIATVRISVHAGARKLGGWTWTPRRGRLPGETFRRVAFRPGEHGREVVSTEFRPGDATRVRVVIEAREPDDHADLRVEFAVLA